MVSGRRINPVTVMCVECYKEFETFAAQLGMYCSEACRERVRYRRDRVKRLAAVQDYRDRNRKGINGRARIRRLKNSIYYKVLAAESYLRHRGKRIAGSVKWQRDNPGRVAVRNAKRRVREGWFSLLPRFQTRALGRSRHACTYCGVKLDLNNRKSPTGLHWDHVVPLSRGGRNSEGNVVPACSTCV